MAKRCIFLSLVLCNFTLSAFEKLPSRYQVSYGNPDAPIHVTEYFSLSCPKCLESFRRDFKSLREKYIDSQKVYWAFHVIPADVLSLQAMVCLEQLPQKDKRIFWEVLLDTLDDLSEGALIMQISMEKLGNPNPELGDLSYLKSTESFQTAYRYLKQSDTIKELPTIEINGKIYDEFPTRKFIEKQLTSLLTNRTRP